MERAQVKGSEFGDASGAAPGLPESLLYDPPSILEPIDVARLFPRVQPLEVELGCGDATFLVEYAAMHPERNFLGIERLLGRIRKLDKKGRRLGLTNLRGIRIECGYFLQYLLPPGSVSVFHIYFPDPWPKKKHRRNRLIQPRFPALAHAALVPGGRVYLRTDDPDYFAQMREVFAAAPVFRPVETPPELLALQTDFEREFRARGIPTLYAGYERD
jgi:tRNA (guanine-N7-)-methyltransferase